MILCFQKNVFDIKESTTKKWNLVKFEGSKYEYLYFK